MRRSLVGLVLLSAVACEPPRVARDGTVTFPQRGAGGAAILTANGVEYHDRNDVPTPLVRRTADEPWRAPLGFILPKNGRFTATAGATVLATTGLAIVLRPSDTRVPSWGGEVLVRVDVVAPAASGTARWGENVAVVVDAYAESVDELVDAALAQLAGRDRVVIVDLNGARVVVPLMPASHRSMAVAALHQHAAQRPRAPRDLAAALRVASEAVKSPEIRQRVLVLADAPLPAPEAAELERLEREGKAVASVVAAGDDLDARRAAVREAVPAAGMTMFRDVRLTFEGTPAPSHVLETSGGDAHWRLEAGELHLGNVRAGEARTEVVRVTVPPWVPGEKFHFTVTVHADDLTWGGPREFAAQVPCVYDDDIERIAVSRHGDVIAYASALATLRRLDAAFVGEGVLAAGGLREIAEKHARSMQLLARDTHDFAIREQADLLSALLSVTR